MIQLKKEDYINPNENINIIKMHDVDDYPSHMHEFVELVYIISGKGRHCINDTIYSVTKGDLLFINFRQVHSFFVDSGLDYVNLLLKPEFMSRELINSENIYEIFSLSIFDEFKGQPIRPIVSFRGRDMLEIEATIDHMLREFNEKKIGYKSILKGYMQVLFARMIREMKKNDQQDMMQYLNKITPELISYIDDNFYKKITLKELAARSFYNPSYFSRVFKEYIGKSLTAYIQEKRIAESARLLSETNKTVEEISVAVGYSDKKQFYKVFKENIGKTPNAYRSEVKTSNAVVKKNH